MISGAPAGYVLVKDKDGKLKYYKDGKFFTLEQIQVQEQKQEQVKQKIKLKPSFSFDSSKKSKPKVAPPKIKKVATPPRVLPEAPVAPKPSLPESKKPVWPKAKPSANPVEVDLEELKPSGEMHSRRSEDQGLIEQKVAEVIERLKIKFSDKNIESRFRNILATYFRGIRKPKELEYILGLPKISGGMELAKDKVQIIMSVLEHDFSEIEKQRRHVVAKPKEKLALQVTADLDHQIAPPPPAIIKPQKKTVKSAPVATPINRPVIAKTMPRPVVQRPIASPDIGKQARPAIRDIKRRRLIGPVEELELMDLDDMRKLGRNEDEIKEAILEKVEILAEQSLLKKIEGINAWKIAPVYKLYLQMTYQGIKEIKKISEVIEQRQIKNQESLTLSEYEMIATLNQKLKFE